MYTIPFDCPTLIKDFLFYMQTIRGKSDKTIYEYFLDLTTFFRFIKIHKGIVSKTVEFKEISITDITVSLIKDITLSDIYEYFHYVSSVRQNTAPTRSRKVSSLRSFFKYLTTKAGVIEYNPLLELEVPSQRKSLPKYLTLEESIDLLSCIDGDNKIRDYCIITLFLNCGMRVSELCALNMNSIRDTVLKLFGKGNKERIVYLNDACVSAIEDYINVRPTNSKEKNALFISRNNNRISVKTVQLIVNKYLKLAGLSGLGYSTHKLRHTAATLMYQKGGVDIRVLQEILGHTNLSSTQIYTHVSSKQLEDAVKSSPLSDIKRKK